MKKWTNLLFISFTFLLVSCVMNAKPESGENKTAAKGEVIVLDKASFLTKVYNYEKNQNEWVYEGDKPCIIDFYADWCGPCRMMGPVVEKLAEKYEGKVKIGKVNSDNEPELSARFQVMSIPDIIFMKDGKIKDQSTGAVPQKVLEDKLERLL